MTILEKCLLMNEQFFAIPAKLRRIPTKKQKIPFRLLQKFPFQNTLIVWVVSSCNKRINKVLKSVQMC